MKDKNCDNCSCLKCKLNINKEKTPLPYEVRQFVNGCQ